LGNYTAKNNSV